MPMAPVRPLARFAWLSVGAAVTTIALKTAAYRLTGSVGLLSDAMESLVNLVAAMLKEMGPPAVEGEEAGLKVYRLEESTEEGIAITREDEAFRITGRAAERAAALTNVDTPEGMAILRSRLTRLGVEKMLSKAGAKAGDQVRVGDAEFTWEGQHR